MKCRLLGNSGLRVSEASLGTMTFGDEWGWGSPKAEAQEVYETYRDAGGNFIDTANFYTGGTSEKFLGEFMQGHRESVVLATKYSNAARGNDPNAAGNHRKNMMQAVEASLLRLQTDSLTCTGCTSGTGSHQLKKSWRKSHSPGCSIERCQ
jgi:aryl-alcohol dehydrogenase-like predicted oxidoreductase